MATRSDLRTSLRIRLEDSAGLTHLWDDAELNEALRTALRTYGAEWPAELIAPLSITPGVRTYSVPAAISDSREISAITDADSQAVPRDDYPVTGNPLDAAPPQSYTVWGDSITLRRSPSAAASWSIHYRSPRLLIEDDVTAQPIPVTDQTLVVSMAAAAALLARSIAEAKRSNDRPAGRLRQLAEQIGREAMRDMKSRRRVARIGQLN